MDRMLSKTKALPGPITLADLPPRDTVRWRRRHKANVVAAVQAGVVSFADVSARYALSVEEFLSWQRTVDRHSPPGHRVQNSQPETQGDI